MAKLLKKTGTVDERDAPSVETVIAELRSRSTSERLLGLYDLGIEGCVRRNAEQATAVIDELIGTLDFAYAEIAEGFQRVYEYCLEQARTGGFDQVAFVLQDLHDTLASAAGEAEQVRKANAS